MSTEIIIIVVSTIAGYIVGSFKAFRDAKQKAYQELLPPILKLAFRSEDANEAEYCEALCKLWLYGNKTVAQKMDKALFIAHDPSRGDMITALQEVIVEMRKDIQLFTRQSLKPNDVQHLFTRIRKVSVKEDSNMSKVMEEGKQNPAEDEEEDDEQDQQN